MVMVTEADRYLLLLRRKRAIIAARNDLIAFTQLMMPDPNAKIRRSRSTSRSVSTRSLVLRSRRSSAATIGG
jgi:hypothetical protein